MKIDKLISILTLIFVAGSGAYISWCAYNIHWALSVLAALGTLIICLVVWEVYIHNE